LPRKRLKCSTVQCFRPFAVAGVRRHLKIEELITKLIRESVRILRVKVTWLLDVPSIDENFTVDGPELIGAWSEHLSHDVWSLPWRRELMVVLVALDEVEHQVSNV